MTYNEFSEAMIGWAKRFKINAEARDFLCQFIASYEDQLISCLADNIEDYCDNYDALKVVLAPEFLLDQHHSAEDIKAESKALKKALDRLSPSTTKLIATIMNPKKEMAAKHMKILADDLSNACSLIERIKFKQGQRKPTERILLVRFLAERFKNWTGYDATSTSGGCFEELVSYAYEYHGINVQEIGRDILNAKKRIQDGEKE